MGVAMAKAKAVKHEKSGRPRVAMTQMSVTITESLAERLLNHRLRTGETDSNSVRRALAAFLDQEGD